VQSGCTPLFRRWTVTIDTGVWHTETYNCPFNRITQNNLHSATRLKCFQKEIPQRLAFIMADRDSRNGTMNNQNFWRKKLWRITIDLPNLLKFFTAKVFFCTVTLLFRVLWHKFNIYLLIVFTKCRTSAAYCCLLLECVFLQEGSTLLAPVINGGTCL